MCDNQRIAVIGIKDVKIRPDSKEYWTGVTVAFHTCGRCEPRDNVWKKHEASFVSPLRTRRVTRVNGKTSLRIPWTRWVATPSLRKRRLPSQWRSGTKRFKCRHREFSYGTVPIWLPVCRTLKMLEGDRIGRRKRTERLLRNTRKSADGKRSPQMCSPFSALSKKLLLFFFFASGRKRIADLEVDFAGVQEGQQRSSATRQVLCGVSCCGARQRWPRGLDTSCARFQTETHHYSSVRLEEVGGSSFREALSARSDSVARAPGCSNFGDQKPRSRNCLLWICCPFSILCVDSNGRVGSNTCRQIGNAQSQVEDVNGASLRLLVETLHLSLHEQKYSNKTIGPGILRKEPNIALTFWTFIAEAVQPRIHSRAPTDAFLFGSGHFQDHRAVVVVEFSTVATTSLQVTNDYWPAICDRQPLAQESAQCLLQQWWQATPLLPTGLTPNQREALLGQMDAPRSQVCCPTEQTESETTLDG